MLTIRNISVHDIEESVIACRNAMRLVMPVYDGVEFKESLQRAIKLCKAGSPHNNFLKGILVSYDIVYPQYISPELQRYHFNEIVTSSSKMHRLMKIDLDNSCNKYVSPIVIDQVKSYIRCYNYYSENEVSFPFYYWNDTDCEESKFENKEELLYYFWMKAISNCPLGLELFMRCTTNYLQLRTIYHQRKNHKLKEDWGAYCQFIEGLPYFKEFIDNQKE